MGIFTTVDAAGFLNFNGGQGIYNNYGTQAITDDPTPLCLSSRMTVETADRGVVRVEDLAVGDAVLTQDGTYSLVYSFSHLSHTKVASFVELQARGLLGGPLEISSDHLLPIVATSSSEAQLMPAGRVQKGDALVQPDGTLLMIDQVKTVQRRGFYHPLTVAGNLVVNGVVVSNYVARDWVPRWIAPTTLAYLEHGGHAPVRWWCTFQRGCHEEERDTATGFSPSLQFWFGIEEWVTTSLPWLFQWMLAVVFAVPLVGVTLVGMVTWSWGSLLGSMTTMLAMLAWHQMQQRWEIRAASSVSTMKIGRKEG